MKNLKRKVLGLFLAVIMLISISPVEGQSPGVLIGTYYSPGLDEFNDIYYLGEELVVVFMSIRSENITGGILFENDKQRHDFIKVSKKARKKFQAFKRGSQKDGVFSDLTSDIKTVYFYGDNDPIVLDAKLKFVCVSHAGNKFISFSCVNPEMNEGFITAFSTVEQVDRFLYLISDKNLREKGGK